jgi:hypothetical protein
MMFSVKIGVETVEQLSTNIRSGLAGIASQMQVEAVLVVGAVVSITLIV